MDENEEEILEDVAEAIAVRALLHIDDMYPAMWDNVAATARISLRNHIAIEVLAALKAAVAD